VKRGVGLLFSVEELANLARGARQLVTECAGVRPGENVLVITDLGRDLSIAYAIMSAALELGAEATVATMSVRSVPGDEPPPQVAKAMLGADVIFQATSTIMIYTKARIEACNKGARFLAMTGITPSVLASPALTEVDFKKQKTLVDGLTKRLNEAKTARVTTPAGTNLELSIDGRTAVPNPGFVGAPGEVSGTPDIEVYIAPVEDSVNGVAVIDGTISTSGLVKSPVKLFIEKGVVRKIEGGEDAASLQEQLDRHKTASVYQVAELGVGLNPKAELRGAIIEDEGALGTVHIALGDNTRFGGANKAPVHIDLVQRNATLELDGEVVIKGREVFL